MFWAGSVAGRVRLTEPGDEQADHAARVVASVAVGAGAQVADGVQEPEGIRSRADLAGGGRGVEQFQQPYPPILIGGRSAETLRVVAEHAGVWNMPGGDVDDAVRRSAMLDRFCAEIGRDPASITRSIILPVSYDHPGNTRKAIAEAIDAGFPHIILSLPGPYPEKVAQWVTDEFISDGGPGADRGQE